MRAAFTAQHVPPGSSRPVLVWVDGGVARDGSAVIVYHHGLGGPLVGQRWVMGELAGLFLVTDPAVLADDLFSSEVEDPDDWYRRLDVDWADGLDVNHAALVWRGQGRG